MPTALTATTQAFLPIHDITDNLVVLKDGSAAMIIETTAVNFGLLSEPEQDAIIYAYAALLNSLNFSIQILIRSQQKDITSYLELLAAAAKHTSQTKRRWITLYRTFVADTVRRRNILDKKFYLIIPFFSLELGTVKSLGSAIAAGTKPGSAYLSKPPAPLETIVTKATTALSPKRDHILKQLERIGLSAKQLTNKEILSLLYRTYNPGAVVPAVDPAELTSPLVETLVAQVATPQGQGKDTQPPPAQPPDQPEPPQHQP